MTGVNDMMTKQSDDVIVKTLSRLLIPFMQIYALYVIAHGHYSPGGGFQGGVILGASLILLVITYGLNNALRKMSEKLNTILCSTGVLIYAGIGLLCVILGENFLDYKSLDQILHVGIAQARSLGILGVEIGVGISVMAVMLSIFLDIATGGLPPAKKQEKFEYH
ncbi:MAG: Na(+)/H(+) antiporter subunit B [Deltaproteobacteria bacterium]|nr:Na(+)/H(+) antiporter subunit B [Deltaproteobacteria bacterium]MBW2742020.1 Na(+)/H(+) antiporter subunit B [Deltaproteobacteria bacterium]